MWEFYLSAAEASLRHEDCIVFQIQLAKRNDVVPITRAYLNRVRFESGISRWVGEAARIPI